MLAPWLYNGKWIFFVGKYRMQNIEIDNINLKMIFMWYLLSWILTFVTNSKMSGSNFTIFQKGNVNIRYNYKHIMNLIENLFDNGDKAYTDDWCAIIVPRHV